MADFNIKTKRDEEVESLAMNLRRNRLASSDSEARRMAEEMLSTGKKVQDDFVEREKRIYGVEKKSPEIDLAHKHVEQLASNLAKGKPNVRIDIPELDMNKPLKELVAQEEEYEKEDDEEVVVKEEPEEETKEKPVEEPEPEQEPAEEKAEEPKEEKTDEEGQASDEDDDGGDVGPGDEPEEPVQVAEGDEDTGEGGGEGGDNGGDEGGDDSPIAEEESDESSESEPDFSVKELDNSEQLRKSEEERKAEIHKMPESKVNLSNMFNVNK